ncbi:hypothetical protein GCM10011369_23300 [Neiella marina]|uniref:Uncharacterized protein n=1 Tax=Neiella marina TaxID=508461 RepID=A0A8J2XPY3_9GAMM|nr:hypothetical protein [Neiella marina]GGA80694.1 hypothetical protein GCM10011369_23300 [Neiella marina]
MKPDDMNMQVPREWGPERRSWHLDKTISLSHIISTIAVIASVFVYVSRLEYRANLNAQEIEHLKNEVQQQARMDEIRRNEFRHDLKAISDKLDRLIEKGSK